MSKPICVFAMLLALLIGQKSVFAQTLRPECGTDIYNDGLKAQNPDMVQRLVLFNSDAKLNEKQPKSRGTGTAKYIIPVVFHIMHNNGSENIGLAQCQDAIRLLNIDYRRQNADTSNARAPFQGLGVDCEIEFRLATKDPKGNCTNGMVKYVTPLTDNANNDIKLLSSWPCDYYYNVWVVRNIAPQSSSGTTLGYAQFPWAGLYRTDGVIIRHDMVGSIGTAATPFTGINYKGRVLTHETGHWLGLLHPFQGGCAEGDQIDDTPPVEGTFTNANCPANGNSCTNDKPDLIDQWENYMDYSSGPCQNMFTPLQKIRMTTAITKERSLIFTNENLIATGVISPSSNCKPKADFIATSRDICDGTSAQFQDVSYQYTGSLTYSWFFEGGIPSTSNAQNPTISYNTPGLHNVKLIVSNGNGTDTMERADYIYVNWVNVEHDKLISEGFESGKQPADWRPGGNNLSPWEVTTNASYTGKYSIRLRNNTGYSNNINNLTTMAYDISGASPTMKFAYANAQRENASGQLTSDRFSLKYSTDCGKTWIQIYTKSGAALATVTGRVIYDFLPPSQNEWAQVSVNLGNIDVVARKNIRFRFEFQSDGGNFFYLDDINLSQTLSSSAFASGSQIYLSPNPAKETVVLNGNISPVKYGTIKLMDIAGREIADLYAGELNSVFSLTLNLPSGIAKGLYLIEINTGNGALIKKLIVE